MHAFSTQWNDDQYPTHTSIYNTTNTPKLTTKHFCSYFIGAFFYTYTHTHTYDVGRVYRGKKLRHFIIRNIYRCVYVYFIAEPVYTTLIPLYMYRKVVQLMFTWTPADQRVFNAWLGHDFLKSNSSNTMCMTLYGYVW